MEQKTNPVWKEVVEELAHEVSQAYLKNYKVVASLEKYKYIITETIEEYGYSGKNFKTKYLPVIIAMALEKFEQQKIPGLLKEPKEVIVGEGKIKDFLGIKVYDNG